MAAAGNKTAGSTSVATEANKMRFIRLPQGSRIILPFYLMITPSGLNGQSVAIVCGKIISVCCRITTSAQTLINQMLAHGVPRRHGAGKYEEITQ